MVKMFTESYACCPATLKPLFGCCAAANYLMIFKKIYWKKWDLMIR